MKTIDVRASRNYTVTVGSGLLCRAGELLRPLTDARRAAIVCGDIVRPLYADELVRSLERANFAPHILEIPHGEEHKTLGTYASLLERLSALGFTRRDLVVSLGGGVSGDIAGFTAATYQRGCGFAQIPTTLLAAVDASVGGKTALDLPGGKNQVGCFYQPLAVLCDPALFSTLPARELRCGMAEVVKCGVLFDREFFFSLRASAEDGDYETIVAQCVAFKRDLVERDELDLGERRLLNLGHSFGHAVESCSGFAVRHGEAVAIGMAMIARAAAARGLCTEETCGEIVSLLGALGLPVETEYPAEALAEAMKKDKKRQGGALPLIVPRELGRCEILSVPAEELVGWLHDGGAQ